MNGEQFSYEAMSPIRNARCPQNSGHDGIQTNNDDRIQETPQLTSWGIIAAIQK